AVDRAHHRPAVLDVNAEHRVKQFAAGDGSDILLDSHGRCVLGKTGQAAGPDHSPETHFLNEDAGRFGQSVADAVMLVGRVNHDVRAKQGRPFGIMIEERAARRENIPGSSMWKSAIRSRRVKCTPATALVSTSKARNCPSEKTCR